MKSAIAELKLKTELNYNAKSFLIQVSEAKEIARESQLKDNLIAVYEIMFDKAQLAVNCNECPFVDNCLKNGETKDCQVEMLKQAKELGVN